MSTSTGLYLSDDLRNPAISEQDSGFVRRRFTASTATMLAQTGATTMLTGDVILLAPIGRKSLLTDFRIYVPDLDDGGGSASVTLDVGDTQVLSGAVTAVTKNAQTTPAVGTAFTLTATASTASFTATNGLLMVGEYPVIYESLSGSTFVNCRTAWPGVVFPDGTAIQQCGNTAAYQSAAVIGQGVAGVITDKFNITGTTITIASPIGTPAEIPSGFNTSSPATPGRPPTLGNIAPIYFTLRLSADINTAAAAGVITGWIGYHERGW